jgi:hypothetical protein
MRWQVHHYPAKRKSYPWSFATLWVASEQVLQPSQASTSDVFFWTARVIALDRHILTFAVATIQKAVSLGVSSDQLQGADGLFQQQLLS